MFDIFWSIILGSITLVISVSAISFAAIVVKEITKQLKK